MPDNKEITGGQDRTRVADNEDYEIQYMVEKTGASREEIKRAIEAVGNNRQKIEEFLKKK